MRESFLQICLFARNEIIVIGFVLSVTHKVMGKPFLNTKFVFKNSAHWQPTDHEFVSEQNFSAPHIFDLIIF